jgi:hypothetical protein
VIKQWSIQEALCQLLTPVTFQLPVNSEEPKLHL